MKSRISLAIFLLIMHLCSWAQIGGDYNPTNPSDPGNPTQEYTLTLKASPSNGGSFNTTSTNIAGGKTYNLRAYPSTDFAFVAWLCNGDTLSKSSSYTYTMPYHDVEIIGVFTYSPSSPSDPNVIAQKYTLTLKATPSDGGSFNTTSAKVSVGERYNLRAYPNTDFAFVAWLCEGDTLSKSASYDYTMPSHNVDITGVFTYRPSSPSDPQEQALKYQLSLTAVPMNSGSFNISNERLAVGSSNSLRAYANTDFVFKRWMIGDSVLSTNANMDFVMPTHNVQMVGVFEYNPASPANPNRNHWDNQTGEVIVDDFTPGNLSSAISSVISGSSSNDVQMIIVSGRITSNDFGVANNYKNCSLLDLSRVTGVTEVPSYAFDYTNLETVYLPSSIEKIGARAFADCSKLSSITVYAMTPPTLESGVFQGVPDGIVVYVPAAAIAQYQDDEAWGKFTLLPIQEDIRSISISLPEGTNAQDYAQMWLELTNTKSGQRMHYVMTDRQTYTFANIIRNTSWSVVLRNERGDVFGQIDNVEVKDEDVTVTFTSLSKPQNVSLSVLTPDGNDVTNQVQVTWTDAQGNYVAQGASLFGLPVGYQANYRMVLSQELAMQYVTPQMVEYVLKDGGNDIVCQLQAIKQLQISGKVKDADTGLPLSGAVVSASQTFGGKYSKTLNAKTDNNGVFTLTIANVPTSIAFAASDYISQTVDLSNYELSELSEFAVPDVSLKSITGATINVGFTYTPVEGEAQNWYSDYQNVSYTLYNITREKPISLFNVQYPQIVLLEEVEDGDVLRLQATSRTNAFMPVEAKATIAEQKAEATFGIVELGQIQSTFTKTGNASVVGSLYDADGKLVKTYDYANALLTISNLADGNYTLVTMGSSRLFNTIYDLAQLSQTGLAEGSDYVLNTLEVKSGQVSAINISEVPTLEESKLYYTGDNTSFTVNKPSIVAGNYLTLTGRIDFKQAYATNVSNVQMIVDLPESCEFVENSVMVGNSISSYTLNGNRITIPMTRYTDRVRFCIIPTLGGEYAPGAFVQFDIDGETVTQPIGSASYTAKDLSVSVPSTIAKSSVTISGTAIGQSTVEIYDDGMLIGNTTSLANGSWVTTCELNEPYNLSMHNIYAKVTTKAGLELISETKQVVYDINMVMPEKVTMLYYNPEYVGQYNIVFDLNNGSVSPKSYYFFPYKSYPNWYGSGTEPKDFTFIADLSNNDSTAVGGLTIRVYTDNGYWRNLEAQYNSSMNKWVAVSQFTEEEAPVGVDVEIISQTKSFVDRKPFDEISNNFTQSKNEISILQDSISALAAELVQTEQSGLRSQETIESIIHSLDRENLTDEESNELISQLSIIAGYTINPEDLEGNVPDMSNEELETFVQNLIEECDSLLDKHDDGMDIYQSKLEELITNADSLAEDNFMIDMEESFSSIGGDTIIIENGDTIISVQRLDLAAFNVPKIDSTQITILPLTDGNFATIYFDDDNTYIVDSINGNVWAIKGISVDELFYSESANSRARRARISSDIIDNLKKAGNTLEKVAARLSEIGSSLSKELKDNIEKLDKFIKDLEKESSELAQLSQTKAQRLAEVRQKLSTLKNKKVYRSYLQQQIDALEAESQALANDIKRLDRLKSNTQSRITKLKSSRMAKVALLSEVTDYVLLANNARKLITYIWKGISDYGKWSSFIDTILPCENDYQNAHSLKYMATDARDAYLREYGKAAGLSGLSTFIAGFMTFNKAAKGLKFVFKLGIGLLNDFLDNTSQSIFNNALNASKQKYSYYTGIKKKLKCNKDDKCPRCGKNPCECPDKCPKCGNRPCTCPDKCPKCGQNPCVCPPPHNTTDVQHDPSGYVYEGVASNRLQGVMASCYYKETVEDMYGDLHDNVVLWNAEEYAQQNPLFTDEYGMYRWDVPKGLWQVKFEKEGYETTYSEWLPVPPPQLDINIAMKQNRQPEVKAALAYEDAVEVEFDKYMMPELLTAENIMVMQNGSAVEGTVELLNEEASYEDRNESFASKVRFNAAQPFTEQEITLLVNNRVRSYAGIRMQDNYQQTFTIEQEIKQIVSDSIVTVGYGNASTLTVSVFPASASKGKMLAVKTSSPMILSVETEQVTIGDDGKAEITVSGELPGTAALTFTVEGTDKTATTIANVEQIVIKTVATPKASIASGSTVEKGTAITLTCETEGATIYYTLDGSCPCDNTGARKVYDGTPIIINENVTIKAMAVAPDMYESEVAEFTYIVEGTGIDNVTVNGQIQIYPLPVHDKVNISAGGKAIKSVTISSMNGVVVASANKPATTVTLDVSRIPTGIYIINVTTVDSTFSRKILKVE